MKQKTGKQGIISQLQRKLNPSSLLILSFLVVILTGTILLSLPLSRNNPISIIDTFFTSFTSTCVTGLITIVPKVDLTIFGQIVVLVMIQVGGLGLMTFVAIALLMLDGKLDFSERLVLKESLNKYDYDNVGGYIKSILKYTFITEGVGFIILLLRVYDGSLYSVFQALFLSISAFCNAGIDLFGSSSLIVYQSDALINIVVSALIILGGLGFVVWIDLFTSIKNVVKNHLPLRYIYKDLRLHSKIVILTSVVLILSGWVFILVFEYSTALKDMPFFDKILTSYFNSVSLRTAGFATFDYSALKPITKFGMMLYMLVGASPGGTGGGFKTTTLFLIFFCIYAELKGTNTMHIYNRHIHKSVFIKATTIVSLYFTILFVGIMVLSVSENLDFIDLMYEACSALGTVGLSIGITSSLSVIGKIVIIILMFIGRVGPISLLLMLQSNKKEHSEIKYPKADIIVG